MCVRRYWKQKDRLTRGKEEVEDANKNVQGQDELGHVDQYQRKIVAKLPGRAKIISFRLFRAHFPVRDIIVFRILGHLW